MSKKHPFILLSGNIGAGKTTLANALSEALSIPVYEEPFEDNPYLEKAYLEPVKYRYQCGKWFLDAAAAIQRECAANGGIQDRGIHESYEVFFIQHLRNGWITQKEFDLMTELYCEYLQTIPAPDLTVYLKTEPETALARIRSRGREMEDGIDLDFLTPMSDLLNEMTENWNHSPLLVLPEYEVEELDQVIKTIDQSLNQ